MVPWIEVASSGSRKAEERPRATHVADRGSVEPAGVEADVVARLDRVAEGALDLGLRALGVEEAVGIDVAAAEAALGRDRPHPARLARPGERVGWQLRAGRDVEPERHGAVDRHPVGEALPVGAHLAGDQRAAEAGAVEEDVARDRRAFVEAQGGDVAGFRVALGRR